MLLWGLVLLYSHIDRCESLMQVDICEITDGDCKYGEIYMVFEYMDHDLAGLALRSGQKFTVPQIKVLQDR